MSVTAEKQNEHKLPFKLESVEGMVNMLTEDIDQAKAKLARVERMPNVKKIVQLRVSSLEAKLEAINALADKEISDEDRVLNTYKYHVSSKISDQVKLADPHYKDKEAHTVGAIKRIRAAERGIENGMSNASELSEKSTPSLDIKKMETTAEELGIQDNFDAFYEKQNGRIKQKVEQRKTFDLSESKEEAEMALEEAKHRLEREEKKVAGLKGKSEEPSLTLQHKITYMEQERDACEQIVALHGEDISDEEFALQVASLENTYANARINGVGRITEKTPKVIKDIHSFSQERAQKTQEALTAAIEAHNENNPEDLLDVANYAYKKPELAKPQRTFSLEDGEVDKALKEAERELERFQAYVNKTFIDNEKEVPESIQNKEKLYQVQVEACQEYKDIQAMSSDEIDKNVKAIKLTHMAYEYYSARQDVADMELGRANLPDNLREIFTEIQQHSTEKAAISDQQLSGSIEAYNADERNKGNLIDPADYGYESVEEEVVQEQPQQLTDEQIQAALDKKAYQDQLILSQTEQPSDMPIVSDLGDNIPVVEGIFEEVIEPEAINPESHAPVLLGEDGKVITDLAAQRANEFLYGTAAQQARAKEYVDSLYREEASQSMTNGVMSYEPVTSPAEQIVETTAIVPVETEQVQASETVAEDYAQQMDESADETLSNSVDASEKTVEAVEPEKDDRMRIQVRSEKGVYYAIGDNVPEGKMELVAYYEYVGLNEKKTEQEQILGDDDVPSVADKRAALELYGEDFDPQDLFMDDVEQAQDAFQDKFSLEDDDDLSFSR